MRLADFILRNMETILQEWEAFARTLLPPAAALDSPALREDAQEILRAIAKDISTPQTKEAQTAKSKRRPKTTGAAETVAQAHAVLRARRGFDINQLAAEYRALRASVLRLWIEESAPDDTTLDDMVRFNEAIDQAIVESIGFFTAQVDEARNLLLGMLGHDMRSPLHTVLMTAQYLKTLNAGGEVSDAASRLIRSAASMKALVEDLMDFSRTMSGLGVKIELTESNLASLFTDELEQLRGAYPDRQIELSVTGKIQGRWDGARLQQLLRNLVVNAIRYGAPETPVQVMLTTDKSDICIQVKNSGPAIEQLVVKQMFDPLKRGPVQRNRDKSEIGLGLGLYIVREVARAHGGEVTVRSDKKETLFTVTLPRRRAAKQSA